MEVYAGETAATRVAGVQLVLEEIRLELSSPSEMTADDPEQSVSHAETIAESLPNRWGLGERRAPNMVHLLEAHGVRVYSLAQECADVDAFSFPIPAGLDRARALAQPHLELNSRHQAILGSLGVEAPPLFLQFAACHQAQSAA
jgi:hypothetical protein